MKRWICISLAAAMLCLSAAALSGENFVFFSENRDVALPVQEHMVGDVNGDEVIDLRDAIALVRHLSGSRVNVARDAVDIDGNGRADLRDLFLLVHHILGDSSDIAFGEISN